MASRKDTPMAYEDVKFILDVAMKKPGLIYQCADSGKATHFKQRCNKYRQLLREQASELSADLPGFRPEISYDKLVISQTDAEGKPDRRGSYLRFKFQEPLGRLIDPETGEEITIDMGMDLIDEEPEAETNPKSALGLNTWEAPD